MMKNNRSTPQPRRKRKPKAAKGNATIIDKLIENETPAFDSFYVEEPALVFYNGGTSVDPKAGLDECGPYGLTQAKSAISVGIIGTGDSIQSAINLLESWKTRVSPGFNKKKPYDPVLFQHFPGNSKTTGFRCDFVTKSDWQRILTELELKAMLERGSQRDKLKSFIDIIVRECEALSDREDVPDIVIITLPSVAEKEFGPAGNISAQDAAAPVKKQKPKGKKHPQPVPGQMQLPLVFADSETLQQQEPEGYWNLHHALKARCMKFDFGTQMVWESTLKGKGVTQDPPLCL